MNDKIKLISGILIWVIFYFSIYSEYPLTQTFSNFNLFVDEFIIVFSFFAVFVIVPVAFITSGREKKKLPAYWGHNILIWSIILTSLAILSKIGNDGSLF
jgi:hypothetical protein